MQDKFSIHKSTNAKGDVLGWAVVANRSVLIKDCATIEEACTLLDAVEKDAPENKFIKDLKAGDVVEAHGGRFFVIEDARESQARQQRKPPDSSSKPVLRASVIDQTPTEEAMRLNIKTIVSLAFKGERFRVAHEAIFSGLGDKYESLDVTLDDVRAASPKIEQNLIKQEERMMQPDFIAGEDPSLDEKMHAITLVNETAEQIRAVFAEIERMYQSTPYTCNRCGYHGAGWLDDGDTCPECKLVQ